MDRAFGRVQRRSPWIVLERTFIIREHTLDIRSLDLFREQVEFIQEQNQRGRSEPLRMTYRVPNRHRVLHLVLYAVSMRVLSTHYKHDIAFTSTLCISAGFLGATLYTASTWACLRLDKPRLAHGLTLLLLTTTLLAAVLLMTPSEKAAQYQPQKPQHPRPRTRWRTTLVLTLHLILLLFPHQSKWRLSQRNLPCL